MMVAPEHSGFGIPEQSANQSAERAMAPAALGLLSSNALGLLSSNGLFEATRAVMFASVVITAIEHGSFVSDPALSDQLVASIVLVTLSCAVVIAFAHLRSIVGHRDPWKLFPASTTPPPPGLTELLSSVDLSDQLEAATTLCTEMGADHITGLDGRESQFVAALSLPPAKHDMLLKALKAVSLRHGLGIWTKRDQEEAVQVLKALSDKALAERMFRLPPP